MAAALVLLIKPMRFIVKRLILIIKLKKLCRKSNAKLYLTHPFSLFSGIHGKNCNLYIETQYEIMSVKLFGLGDKPYYITFMPDRRYTVTRFFIVPGARGVFNQPIVSKEKNIPRYRFDYKFKSEWNFKTFRKILLINPVSMDHKVRNKSSWKYLCNGDFLYDIETYSYNGLKRIIEKE